MRKKGSLLITAGLLLMTAALSLTAYNYWDAYRAQKASQEIVEELESEITGGTGQNAEVKVAAADRDGEALEEDEVRTMPTKVMDGYSYIGVLELPAQGLTLPVMAEWDYERLRISPCRYSGSYFTDDLVLCAHNYARHFSPIRQMKPGDEAYFTTVDRKVCRYRMQEMQTLQPAQISEMIGKETDGQEGTEHSWDLTLFTCDTGGQTRCAVRFTREYDAP